MIGSGTAGFSRKLFKKENIVKAGKIILIVIMVFGLATSALAQNLVIGAKGNLKTGMLLKDAFKVLGFPESVVAKRGASSTYDHIEMNYPGLGILIRTMSGGNTVEAIEILPSFKGKFDTGLKLRDPFNDILVKYGPPTTLSSQIARYPDKGLYFLMSNNVLLSAKFFAKDTKLLEYKLATP